MFLLKHKHRPESYRSLAASTHVHALCSHSLDEIVPTWAIPSDESTHSLTSEIQDLARVFRLELLELREHIGTNLACMLHEVETGDLVVDGIEEKNAGGVADPGVVSEIVRECCSMNSLRFRLTACSLEMVEWRHLRSSIPLSVPSC